MPNQRSENKTELKMFVTKDMKRKLKLLAEMKNTSMTEVIQELLTIELENQDWSDEAWLPIARELACAEMGVSELSEIGDDAYAEKIVQQCLGRVRGKSHADTQKMISEALRDREIIDEMAGKKPAKKKSARKRA